MVKKFIKNYSKWCFLAPFILFLLLSYAVVANSFDALDYTIYTFIIKSLHPIVTTILKWISISGTFIFMLLVGCVVFYKNKKIGKILLIHLLISDVLKEFLKLLFLRDRPDILRLIDINGYSFPSGHAMLSLCFYGLCIYVLMKSNILHKEVYSIALVILVCLIGVSRIYLGIHYFSDVLGGFLCGLTYLLVVINNSRFKT